MTITQLRHSILRHLRMSLILGWAGNLRLATAAREFAALLRAKLAILRAAQ